MTSQKLKLPHGIVYDDEEEEKGVDDDGNAPDQPPPPQPPQIKRPKLQIAAPAAKAPKLVLPFRKIVTWNCNGFTTRCRLEQSAAGDGGHQRCCGLRELVRQTRADVYCLQEVRLKAAAASNRGTPLEQEYRGAVERVLTSASVFADYRPFWSLADSKYAGTLTLIRKRVCQENGDLQVAFSVPAARNLLLKSFGLTAQDCGIAIHQQEKQEQPSNSKSKSGNGDKKQRSVASFFAAKKSSSSSASSSSSKLPTSRHDSEGRFQFFRFPQAQFDLIQTYVPNSGDRPEKWQRRADWDRGVRAFLRDRQLIYQKAGIAELPRLLWCGDLNVARDYRDGTHWRRIQSGNSDKEQDSTPDGGGGGDDDDKKASSSNSIYEWWTDESQCFVQRRGNGSGSSTNSTSKHPDHVGIPGFTPAERRRFHTILDEADLVDVWRALHPDGDTNSKLSSLASEWDAPNWTWRGHLSKNGDKKAKYEGRGQRLDYFLLSPSRLVTAEEQTATVVESCTILGYGSRREGLFCGSDHCAVALTFKDDCCC